MCIYSNVWLFMVIFNKMCKIVSICFYCILKPRIKKRLINIYLHNNLRYIAQSYTLLYILKMYICLMVFYCYKIVKNGYCRNWVFFNFAWDLGVIFFRHNKFYEKFLIPILRCHRKMYGLFHCIPIFVGPAAAFLKCPSAWTS